MRLKPYVSYKDSGVAWLGNVPAHWEAIPLKRATHINARVLPESTKPTYEFRYIDIGSVGTGRLTAKPEKLVLANAPSRARRILQEGDTIVSTVRTYLKAVYYVSEDGDDLIASTGFAVLTPGPSLEPKYVSYFVQSDPFTEQVTAHSVGIAYPAIAETRLGVFRIPVPPLVEQHAIARFLDHLDTRINRTIRAKRKLIALLNEQKQAIIHRAVTRGLDPDAPLRPSGVEWLGVIPAHWDVRRTKYVLREVDERSKTGEETHLSMSQRFGLIPSSNIEERRLLSESYIGAKICRENDLVLNRLKAHLGVFALAKQDGLVSPDYTVLRPMADASVRYFEMVLRAPACRGELRKRAKGIVQGFWRLYTDDFYDICVPFPPQPEQDLIVRRVDEELQVVEAAINRAYREMDLIREYRTRLIADVVTGKFDVRAAAAALPEKLEEIEPEAAEDEEGDLDPEPDGQWEEETDAP